MGVRQYFSGVIKSCVTGIAMMGKTAANRIIPIKLNDDGSIDIGQTIPTPETFKKATVEFVTAEQPDPGIIVNTNLISPWWDNGESPGDGLLIGGAGTSGTVFGGKLLLNGIPPTQAYKLYLFSGPTPSGNYNGSAISAIEIGDSFIGVIDFSTLISSATGYTIYDASMNNPIAFNGADGNLYGLLQNANGTNVTIPPGTAIVIQLSILSK